MEMWRVLTTFGPKVSTSQPQPQQHQPVDEQDEKLRQLADCLAEPKMVPPRTNILSGPNAVHWPRTSTMKPPRKDQPLPPANHLELNFQNCNEDYKVVRLLGSGGFGEAYLARRRSPSGAKSTAVVLKRMRSGKEPGNLRLNWARREAAIMATLQHQNIVRFFRSFEEAGQVVLEMEFCDGGDLRQFLRARNGSLLTERQIRSWFHQITSAVAFIHDQHIIHRDIKSKNILLHDGGHVVKLGDFGAAKCLMDKSTGQVKLARSRVGTSSHHPPEFCRNKRRREYGPEVDVWALGVVLFEMTTLRMPFEAKSEAEMTSKIASAVRDSQISRAVYSPALRRLVDVLMSPDPDDRPTLKEIAQDRFFQTYRRYLRRSRVVSSKSQSRSDNSSGHHHHQRPVPPPQQPPSATTVTSKDGLHWKQHHRTDAFFCLLSSQPGGAAAYLQRRLGQPASPPVWRQPFSVLKHHTARGV